MRTVADRQFSVKTAEQQNGNVKTTPLHKS